MAFSGVFLWIPSIPCFSSGSPNSWTQTAEKTWEEEKKTKHNDKLATRSKEKEGEKRSLHISAGSSKTRVFHKEVGRKKQTACVGVFEVLTDSGDPPGRYPRHVFKFQNLRTFHSGRGEAVLSLRRLPACEWRRKERNVTLATGEGGGRREEAPCAPQYLREPIEGAPGPAHGTCGNHSTNIPTVSCLMSSCSIYHFKAMFNSLLYYSTLCLCQ